MLTVVKALSNGQVGPPEGTLPRYLAKVPPPPPPWRPKVQGGVGGGDHLAGRRSKVRWGGGTLSGVPGTLGR